MSQPSYNGAVDESERPASDPSVKGMLRDPAERLSFSRRMRLLRNDHSGSCGRRSWPRIDAPDRTRSRAVFGKRMVEKIMSAYHVTYERDESGWWVASVREVRGCHTQGRTVDEARRRIRKAMELFVDDARSAKLIDNVKLPAPASKAIRLYAALRRQADREDQRASLAARRAVRLLRGGKLKMSARDAARLLGVSHQRVHQLVHDAD